MLLDKKWPDIFQIFDKSVDYKEIYQGKFHIKEEVDLNKIERDQTSLMEHVTFVKNLDITQVIARQG